MRVTATRVVICFRRAASTARTRASKEISAGTAARILRRSSKTINRLCEAGQLEAVRIPPRGWWRIDFDSVIDFRERQRGS